MILRILQKYNLIWVFFLYRDSYDSFVQAYSNISDVIIVVDNSGSMSRFHNNLSSNISRHINQYLSYNIDFRIGIITTDSAFFNYNYVDNSTQGVSNYLSSWILSIGTNGGGTQKRALILFIDRLTLDLLRLCREITLTWQLFLFLMNPITLPMFGAGTHLILILYHSIMAL